MNRVVASAIAVVGTILIASTSFYVGRHGSAQRGGAAEASPSGATAADGRKVLYWHDPMVPAQRFDKPGKSPFMDMQLVPVYANEVTDNGGKVSAAVQQNLGMRLASVRMTQVESSIDVVGAVQFDARLEVAVQTRVAGFVEQLAVRAPMERVKKGQPLATIFAPEWLGPQNELLALKRAGATPDLVAAARDRMRAMSIPADLIRQSEVAGTAQARFTLSAPASGVVTELGVREGVAVTPGTTLFRIAGLEKVWAVAEVPEAQAFQLSKGQHVKAVLQSDATRAFDGELKEILPQVNANTRTVQARFEVSNKDSKLIPGMWLQLKVMGPASSRLLVASEAVIRTGKRSIVIVRGNGGGFESRDVLLGSDIGDDLEILQGLSEGDQVVASGQFLLDSEARLRSALDNMAPVPSTLPSTGPAVSTLATGPYHAEGKVESVDSDSITISHGPVAALKWPPMTMSFGKPEPKAFAKVRPGDSVRFEFKQSSAGYQLQSVEQLGASK